MERTLYDYRSLYDMIMYNQNCSVTSGERVLEIRHYIFGATGVRAAC